MCYNLPPPLLANNKGRVIWKYSNATSAHREYYSEETSETSDYNKRNKQDGRSRYLVKRPAITSPIETSKHILQQSCVPFSAPGDASKNILSEPVALPLREDTFGVRIVQLLGNDLLLSIPTFNNQPRRFIRYWRYKWFIRWFRYTSDSPSDDSIRPKIWCFPHQMRYLWSWL